MTALDISRRFRHQRAANPQQPEVVRTFDAIREMGYSTEEALYLTGDAVYGDEWRRHMHPRC